MFTLNNSKTVFLGAIVMAALVAILFWFLHSTSRNAPDTNGGSSSSEAMPVTAITLAKEDIEVLEALPGRVVPFQVSEIRPQVTGILKERRFIEGSYVEEGSILYEVESSPYEASYDSAVAALEKAQANLRVLTTSNRRFEELLKTDAVSKQDYDNSNVQFMQAKAELSIAEAALNQAKINLEFTKVVAPISGRIGKSAVTKGALLTANQVEPIATITQLQPVYVDMTISSWKLNYLRQKFTTIDNLPVIIFPEDGDNADMLDGVLKFHEMTVDPSTSSVQLRAEFANKDITLLPGSYTRASLKLTYYDVMLIPQKATQRQADGKLSVWVINPDNTVSPKQFAEEVSVGDKWLIRSGLKEGYKIVTHGVMKLQPGTKVEAKFEDVASASQVKVME